MARVIGPWSVQYPVNYVSHGDTVRAAFGKHINEIERIYGLLSGLGAAKIEAEDLTAAMTANKNEWTTAIAAEKSARESAIAAEKSARESAIAAEVTARSNGDTALGRRIDGLTFGDIGGTLGLDRTTGNLPSSRVSGNFGTDRIDGLSELITSLGGGTLDIHDNGDSGYIKFSNDFIIQWAVAESIDGNYSITYPIPFPNKCIGGTVGYPKDNYSKTGYQSGSTNRKYMYVFFGY